MAESRPTFSQTLAKAAARAASRGVREVAAEAWDQVRAGVRSQGALKLMIAPTGGERPDAELRFALATEADAEPYARDIGTDSPATFRARLTGTTICCLVYADDKVLHASWVTTSRAWTSEIRAFLVPPAGDAYIYESFTRADARGRGIYPFALGCIRAELAQRGSARAWVGVESDNERSIRAITKAGFVEAFEIRFRRRWGGVKIDPPSGPLAEAGPSFISRREVSRHI